MCSAVTAPQLIRDEDGPAVEVVNIDGSGPFVLACEHASPHIPAALGNLGLPPEALASHIAWDPGARALGGALSSALDAPLVAARFSRLVFDCNRPPGPAGVAERSDRWSIPGNQGLGEAQLDARIRGVYEPFHQRLATVIQERLAGGLPTVVVTVHSFTPILNGERRELELGILHDSDTRLADSLLRRAAETTRLDARRNQPYGPKDGVTHTLQLHAIPKGLANAMLEVRNDLIEGPTEVAAMADQLGSMLNGALADLTPRSAA
jgi:predicted N-formylglutamate amidohydrolase